MRVIIAGGRAFHDMRTLEAAVAAAGFGITSVLSGACHVHSSRWWKLASGADGLGELWALHNGVAVIRFYADRFGAWPSCGPRRNRAMAEHGEALIALPGGKGTASMLTLAQEYRLRIFDARGLRTGG